MRTIATLIVGCLLLAAPPSRANEVSEGKPDTAAEAPSQPQAPAATPADAVAEPAPAEAPAAAEAPGDDSDAREADMFGGGDENESREADMFGGGDAEDDEEGADGGQDDSDAPDELERVDQEDLLDRLDDMNDTLAIGGRAWLRTQYNGLQDGNLEDFALTSSSLLDLYLDGRPSDRVRVYLRGRLTFDPSAVAGSVDFLGNPRVSTTVVLDQFWTKVDAYRRVFFTVGKQRIKWGAGRFWNPTDFLNQQRLDPLAVLDLRLGRTLVKVHVPVASLGWNFYGLLDLEGASTAGDVGAALRGEFLLGTAEVALSAASRKNNPIRLGADISLPIWVFDLRAEGAVLHPQVAGQIGHWEGGFDLLTGTFPTLVDQKNEWIPQGVVGLEVSVQYNDEDTVTFGGEYFYNDLGYDDPELYPWLLFNGAFNPLYNGKHYAGGYAVLFAPGRWNDTSFILSVLSNLSDRTGVTRFDYRVNLLTYANVNAFVTHHWGPIGEFKLGIDVPPAPFIDPRLADGIHIAAPMFEAGVGVTINI